MNQILGLIPHIPSNDVDETCRFLRKLFDFEERKISGTYVELSLGSSTIGILKSDGALAEQSIYFQVESVDALWSKAEKSLISTQHKKPFDQEYGMREFHVVVPGTNTLIFVGQKCA